MSKIAIAASLFAVGCTAEERAKNDVEPSVGDGQADDLAATRGTPTGGPFAVVGLRADTSTPGLANVDAQMINPWGIVAFAQTFWVTYNGTGLLSTLDGQGMSSTGILPSGEMTLEPGITGITTTGVSPDETSLFQIHGPGVCAPALLLVVSESGKMFGVNPKLGTAVVVADRSGADAIYKGVAVLERKHDKRGPVILAADFHNAQIDVFDARFNLVNKNKEVSFETSSKLAKNGFAPFNVAVIDDTVYVTYAKQDDAKEDDVAGAGLGYVAAFSPDGHLRRLVTGPELNAPWAMVLARRFDSLPPSLLVGNFGSGQITVLQPGSLKIRGLLKDQNGQPITIDGLWGMAFGDDVRNARPDALYFASGPGDEQHGLFGAIVPARRCSDDGCK